jgi:hypothetical protein
MLVKQNNIFYAIYFILARLHKLVGQIDSRNKTFLLNLHFYVVS